MSSPRPSAAPPAPSRPHASRIRRLRQSPRLRGLLALLLLLLAVLAVYCPPRLLTGQYTLVGGDYFDLHQHRIRFAQEALFGPNSHLPAWYPRELLGTPFWSNIQSFPFIPTRLALLKLDRFLILPAGVILAALLAALFTYLYCRRIGLGRTAAAAAGWTFACAGYYASRVMVGHLPLLEAYPALPLLLWLIERSLQSDDRPRRYALNLIALALASASAALAGHPQLSIYSFEIAGLYLLYRGRSRKGLKAALAIGLGLGLASFALWPMLQLTARSTRILPLDPPDNNIAFPFWRLDAFFLPWRDGWPSPVDRGQPHHVFHGPGTAGNAYFWDTVCYVGWLPLLAAGFLLIRVLRRRNPPSVLRGRAGWGLCPDCESATKTSESAPAPTPLAPSPGLFFALVGFLALLLALPPVQQILAQLPGTLLRSPARQVYLTGFSLALALGWATHLLLARAAALRQPRLLALIALALLLHGADLGWHDHYFIYPVRMSPPEGLMSTLWNTLLRTSIGDGRIGFDLHDRSPMNRQIDDVGFFDSIMLARPYRALMDLTGASPRYNTQWLSGAELSERALAYASVRQIITSRDRPDLLRRGGDGNTNVYAPRNPAPRAAFFPLSQVLYLDEAEIHRRLRDPAVDLQSTIMLPPSARPAGPAPATQPAAPAPAAPIPFSRLSPDHIRLSVTADRPGILRIVESWDPGWRATLDGQPAPVLIADDFVLAVQVPPGQHQLDLTYTTPGARFGAALSGLALLLLTLLTLFQRRFISRSPAPDQLPSS